MSNKLTDVKRVLDGHDINQDIHYLIGYVWSLGNTEKVFPDGHCGELAQEFLKKHNKEIKEKENEND